MRNIVITLAVTIPLWGCDYARMSDQESVRTYEASIPEMPQGTIPVQGGFRVLREADAEDLKNPLPYNRTSIDRGKKAYAHFCMMCHGPEADGKGTVGQSFYPLPANLRDDYIQEQSDGELFYVITFGYGRHPPLGYTAAEKDRWAIVHHIRFLGKDTEG